MHRGLPRDAERRTRSGEGLEDPESGASGKNDEGEDGNVTHGRG